jgi:RHS repeat-associated protein
MPKELVDQDGRVAWAAAHSAWGRVVETWRDPLAKRAVETPFRLLGQYLDDETGLCCTRFRYFDPEVGRWLSPDPLGFAGGRNLFAFDGSPTVRVDPLGLCGEGGEVWNDKNGVDFAKSKYLYPAGEGQKAIVTIEYTGSRRGDYKAANIAAGLEDWKSKPPTGYTWHHLDDYDPVTNTGTMQLVQEGAHVANYPHNGGVDQYRQAHGMVKYR